jgi:hypothetical protein
MSSSSSFLGSFPNASPSVNNGGGGNFNPAWNTTGNANINPSFGTVPGGFNVPSSSVVGQTDYYDSGAQNINGFQTHHMSITLGLGWKEGDTCQGMPTWVKGPKSTTDLVPMITSYQAFSLPMLNFMLKYDPDWRALYGSELSIQPFLNDWRYVGTQQTKELAVNNGCWSNEINFIIGGRTRQPSFYHANQQSNVSQFATGSQMYVVYTRHPFTNDRVMNKSTWDQTCSSDGFHDDDDGDTVDCDMDDRYPVYASSSLITETSNKSLLDLALPATFNNEWQQLLAADFGGGGVASVQNKIQSLDVTHKRDTQKQYYWSVDPWVSPDGSDPHPSIWNGSLLDDPDNAFEGDYRYLGVQSHTLGGSDNAVTRLDCKTAREAIYPKSRGMDYRVALNMLPYIELMEGNKHAHTVSF